MDNPGPVCTADAAATHSQGLRHCICWSGPATKGFILVRPGHAALPGAQCISCATQLSRPHASYQGFGIACAGQEWPCCAPRCAVHLPAVPYCCPCHRQAHPAELQRAQRRGDQLHADHLLVHWGYPGTCAVCSHLRGAYTQSLSASGCHTQGTAIGGAQDSASWSQRAVLVPYNTHSYSAGTGKAACASIQVHQAGVMSS